MTRISAEKKTNLIYLFFFSTEEFTRITSSGTKDFAPLTTKRTSFKHKYVSCGSGAIHSSHTANSINVAATYAVSGTAHQKV